MLGINKDPEGKDLPEMAFPLGQIIPGQPNKLTGEQSFMVITQPGMSLRDWFAGMAIMVRHSATFEDHASAETFAGYCYHIADAMMKARKEVKP